MSQDLPLVLALDTATSCSTVSLTRGNLVEGEVLASVSYNSKVTHSRRLISLVDAVLQQTETDLPDLDGIAVGLGPGSFTGLRIGMATAKGLAATSGKKLIGIPTLDGLASQCLSDKKIYAVMDARKQQVYTAFYSKDAAGFIVRQSDIRAISPEELVDEIDEPVIMIGDGALNYQNYWREKLGSRIEIAPLHLHYPSAAITGLLACKLLQNDETLEIAAASPLYVRASDAELSLVRKKMY